MENKTIENHEVQTQIREMRVNGHVLKKRKVVTIIEGHYDPYVEPTKIVEIEKSIEDVDSQNRRCLKTTEHFKSDSITGIM